MTNIKPKNNPLLVIIVIAIALFLSAFLWKMNNPSNEEIVTVNNSTPKIVEEKIKDVKVTTVDVQKETNEIINTEEKQFVTREDKAKLMGLSYKYTTEESILEGIEHFESIGDMKTVNKLYQFLDGIEAAEKVKNNVKDIEK